MKIFILFTMVSLLFAFSAFTQNTDQEKIYGKWKVEKFEVTKTSKNADKVQEQLKEIVLKFNKNVVEILKRGECSDLFIKSGPFSLNDNIITFGVDEAVLSL